MTATLTTSLRERAEAIRVERERKAEDARVEQETTMRDVVRAETRDLINRVFGDDTETDNGLTIDATGNGSARFSIDGLRFAVRSLGKDHPDNPSYRYGWYLFLERSCAIDGCLLTDTPVVSHIGDLDDLAIALDGKPEHPWDLLCKTARNDEGDPIKPVRVPRDDRSPEERALDEAARGHADALNVVSLLEDQRSLIKAASIKSMIGTPNEITGKAHSASSAEAIVEAHPDYMTHRDKQRAAEVEKWRTLATWEAAKLKARLAGAGQ